MLEVGDNVSWIEAGDNVSWVEDGTIYHGRFLALASNDYEVAITDEHGRVLWKFKDEVWSN